MDQLTIKIWNPVNKAETNETVNNSQYRWTDVFNEHIVT